MSLLAVAPFRATRHCILAVVHLAPFPTRLRCRSLDRCPTQSTKRRKDLGTCRLRMSQAPQSEVEVGARCYRAYAFEACDGGGSSTGMRGKRDCKIHIGMVTV